ncbi:hypothetical protein AVEN_80791-1 [Araneus ventricosus]|uniref:Reverse transcriptase domain-containing protein n=1 Tax=Araneus ventricosus TaxID=182803 RepID=A0A4Y2FHQ3_ARAVE|nr:hypothetical protein AVEN_80791-1 [Araneus ventricosus]
MDLKSVYWQIEVDKDREKTEFLTPDGLYQFKVTVFGYSTHRRLLKECGTVGTEKKYYIRKVWPKRQFLIQGVKNEEKEPLVASEKILLPQLHIRLGLRKNFVKAMDCGGSGFHYLRLKFPRVSETKIMEGIFVGPQFRQLMKDPVFKSKLTKKEAAAWTLFKELEKKLLRKS